MKRDRKLLPGNGVMALAALFALGVGFVFAQDTPPDNVNRDGSPTANPKASAGVKAPAVPQTEAGAEVQTPPVGRDGRPLPRTGAAGAVEGQVQAPGIHARTQVQGNAKTNARVRTGIGFKVDGQGNQGMRITDIQANSAAAKAGFRANDRIVSVDGRTFPTQVQFRAYLATQGGRRVPVVIDRGGQQFTIEFALDDRPAEGAWLGVNLDEETATNSSGTQTRGARIARIYPSGPAAQAGLSQGDVIVSLNNQPVAGAYDVVNAVQEMQPQSQVEVGILRDNAEMKVAVVLGDRSNYLGRFQPSQFQGQHQAQYAGQQNTTGQANRGNDGDDIPPYAMQMEQERRMAEQHERIEDEIRQLRDEIKKLREMLEKK